MKPERGDVEASTEMHREFKKLGGDSVESCGDTDSVHLNGAL